MSRALRRHPVATTKGGRQRAARSPMPRPSPRRRSQRQPQERRGLRAIIRPRWAEDIIGELSKVTWPTLEDTRYLTFVVLVVAVTFGIFLGGIDMFFNWVIDRTLF